MFHGRMYLMDFSWSDILSTVLLEKLTGPQLVKTFHAFNGVRSFITKFTTARHLSLSWARSIQSRPTYPNSLKYIFILSSPLRLALPSGPFPSGLPTKIHYKYVLFPIRATCPVHLVFDLITRIPLGEEHRSWSCSVCSLLRLLFHRS